MIDFAHLSPWLIVAAPLMVMLGYTVFGLSGFGSTAIVLPVLAHFLPVSYLVPAMAMLDMVSSALVGRSGREHLARAELKSLLPYMFVGFVLGATLLVNVPDRWLRAALGAFTMVIGMNSIVNPVLARAISRWWAIPTGVVGGMVTTMFGAGGPIYATFLSARLSDKNAVRATMSTLISVSSSSRVVIYLVSRLLSLATVAGAAAMLPFMWVGVKIGGRIHVGLTAMQMRRVLGALLIFTGASLLVHTLL